MASLDHRRLDWGRQASLFRPRVPAFWVYVVVMAVSLFLLLAEQTVFRRISPSGYLLAWFLLILYAAPVFLLVYLLDLFEREPLSLVFGALAWGAVAAASLAAIANQGWGLVVARLGGPEFASQWTAALTAPFAEEALKVLGVVLIVLIARDEVDDVMDGFVYGAMVGLGFSVIEDVFYFMAVFGGQPSGVLTGFFVRVLASGLYGHVLYSGLAGMGVAYFITRRDEASLRKRWVVLGGLFFVAVGAHLLWNSPWLDFFPAAPWTGVEWVLVPLAAAVKGLPFLAFVAVMVWLSHRRERAWLDGILATEVGGPAITTDEYEVLRSARRRRTVRGQMRTRSGRSAERLLHRLQRAQIDLAMVRTRRPGGEDETKIQAQRNLCVSLRDALMAIPGAAPAVGQGSSPQRVPAPPALPPSSE